ncbi:uncharacterized protein [Engystomops pustulosus]|uniref:uncharacterized protein isoform X2 n=1 Tax=Engystomops pustulosus TaxID=76066 RepID=UPI003AFB652D
MDSDNIKSLDTKYSSRRLPARTNLSSPQKICFDRAALRKPLKLTVVRDTKTHSVGCHHPNTSDTIKRGTLLSPLLDKKTEWLFQDDLQPEESEQVHTVSEVQDGNSELGSRSDPTRSIYVYDRSERCVLPCANTSKISKVPQIRSMITLGRRGPLSVQGAAFWDFFGPQDIHKNHDRGDSFPEAERDSSHPLPGRSVTGGRFETRAYTPPRFHNEDPTAVRMDNKPGKVQTKLKYRSCVSRNIIGFDPADVLLPPEKATRLMQHAIMFQKRSHCTIREAMRILGLMTSSIQSVQWSQSHTRVLQSWILASWDKDPQHLNQKIQIPEAVKQSLEWWIDTSNLGRGISWHPWPVLNIRTDASQSGWGADIAGLPVQGLWPSSIRSRSSNFRELRAVLETLRASAQSLRGKHVRIYSDNTTTVAYLRHQGGTRNPDLLSLSDKIFIWAETNIRSLSATHLKGEMNQIADYLSRQTIDHNEWCLNEKIFSSLTQKWGQPVTDLFATSKNTKVPHFFSLDPNTPVCQRDAFSQSWSGPPNVCLSSYTSHSESDSEDQRRPSKGYTHCSLVAKEELVSVAREDGIGRTCHAGTSKQSSVPGSSLPSRSTGSPALGMDPERRLLISRGLSNKVLDFLQAGFDKGLKTNSLKVQISALSAFFDTPLAENRWIQRIQNMPKNRNGIR